MALTIVIGNRNDSSWSLRGWLALRMSGAAFDEILVPLGRPDSRERILQYSPTGKVPLLKSEDGDIWDSLAIAEYLAERFPEAHLWPRGEAARALARSVCAEMHSGFAALRGELPMDLRRQQPLVELSEATRQDIQRICEAWADCRRRFGQDVRPRQPGGCVLRTGGGAFPQLCGGIAGYRPDLCRDDLSVACVPRLVRRGIARAGR